MEKEVKIMINLILKTVRKKYPFIKNIEYYDNYRGFETVVSISKLKEFYNLKYDSWFKNLYEENPEEALETISYSPIIEIPFKMEDNIDDILDIGEAIEFEIKNLTYRSNIVPSNLKVYFRTAFGYFGSYAGSYIFEE
jgi:hypothetical protein